QEAARVIAAVKDEVLEGYIGLAEPLIRCATLLSVALPDNAVERLLRIDDPDIAAVAGHHVIAMGQAVAPALLSALDKPELPESTAVALLGALGRVGDITSVKDILPYSEGLLRAQEVKRAARAAIDQIQAANKGAGAGQLALSEEHGQAGGVSLSIADSGGMSLEEDEHDRLEETEQAEAENQ
ncbi:MAG: hypothetical protein KC561_20890, partial [Myxococcales bacterium]|nr:hypothetical protein [Myxococcales bacterium]